MAFDLLDQRLLGQNATSADLNIAKHGASQSQVYTRKSPYSKPFEQYKT